jgi:hypothetical protein
MVEVYPRHRQRPSFRLGTLVDWSTGVQPQIWINHWASKLGSSSPKIKDERWTPGFFFYILETPLGISFLAVPGSPWVYMPN